MVVLSGLAVVGVLLVLIGVALRSPNGIPFVPYRTVNVVVPDPGNLEPHNDVQIAGVRVGQVVAVNPGQGESEVQLKLLPGTQRLPIDTKVYVRAQGLLGARYVQLVPGTSHRLLADGGSLRGNAGSLTYGIPDALNTFDAKTRASLGATINALGGGLLGRGQGLGLGISAAPPDGRDFKTIVAAVLSHPGAASRLLPSIESATSVLDSAQGNIAQGFAPAADALGPFNTKRSAFGATLDQAPPALTSAQAGLGAGVRLLAALRTLSTSVDYTLPSAPPGLRALTQLMQTSHTPLARGAALLRRAQPAVPAVLRILQATSPVLPQARQVLDNLDPVVGTAGAHGCDLVGFGESWRSLLGYGINAAPQDQPLPNGFIGDLNALRITPVITTNAAEGVNVANPNRSNQSEPYSPPCKYAFNSVYPTTPGTK